MKKLSILFSAIILIIVSFCCVHGLKASPAVPAVYDSKQAPGSMCRVVQCSFVPPNLTMLQQLTMAAGGHALFMTNFPAITDTCLVTCPIIRDRYVDEVGLRGIWIDATVSPLAGGAGSTRKITCQVENTTGKYTLNGVVKNQSQLGPAVSTPTPVTSNLIRLTAPNPYPPTGSVPVEAWTHGATYTNGYSSILCDMPIQSTIQGYGWMEYGGESTDY